MKTWTRAASLTICGGPCQGAIRPGDPMLEFRIAGLTRLHRRCVRCAEELQPPDLPPAIEKKSIALSSWTRAGTVKLPFEIPAGVKR